MPNAKDPRQTPSKRAVNPLASSAPRLDGPPPGTPERRSGIDRRDLEVGGDGAAVSYNRRRGPGRRLSDFTRAAEEGELNQEQFLFLMAIDEFKRANGLTFPAWTDVLEVFRLLGYRKTMPCEFRISRAEDWTERPDAPANVRPAKHSDVPDADTDRREAA